MRKTIKIALDLMGNENAPQEITQALQNSLLPKSIELFLIGTHETQLSSLSNSFVKASSFILMEDHPLQALKKKKNSSMVVGLRLLKEQKVDAFITLGNTGALVAASKIILGCKHKIKRPALLAFVPTKKHLVAVLDVGGYLDAKAEHLVQFAFLGSKEQIKRGIKKPKVALLNIGSEPLKGTSELKRAYEMLKIEQNDLFEFVGNVEAKEIFEGNVDVVVTDAFTGNVFLKTAEGVKSFIQDLYADEHSMHCLLKLSYKHYEPAALLVGVEGTVVKCHSYSSLKEIIKAVEYTVELVKKLSNDL